MIRVLIADDHRIVREGLKQLLERNSDIVVAGEASRGEEVLAKVEKNDYDVILLDISMPGRGGVEILKQLKNEYPKLPILVLSMHPEEQYAVRVLKAGAFGYLTKESASDELIAAIRKVAQGKKYITSAVAEKLAFNLESPAKEKLHEGLSDREYQVMCMIALGKTAREVANELSLSIKTISTYRSRILEKMKIKGNAELIRYAIVNGLV